MHALDKPETSPVRINLKTVNTSKANVRRFLLIHSQTEFSRTTGEFSGQTRCGSQANCERRYGSAKVNRPSPAAIVTICLPFTEYVIGFALMVPPRLIFQSSLPLSASSAKK